MDIQFSFDNEFEKVWYNLEKKYPKLLEIEGLKREQLDFTQLMASFYNDAEVVADVSVDGNSNVASKNVVTIKQEVSKPYFKLNFLYMMWKYMKKLYGLDKANEFLEAQILGKIYCNDAYECLSYCYNFSAYDVALNGLLYEHKIKSKAPKHIKSFLHQTINFIAFTSNQILGACLYKNQELIIRENGVIKIVKIKDLVSRYNLNNSFNFQSQNWECSDVLSGLEVWEDGKFVKLKRVFRRKYDGKIYKIKTHSGKECICSEDHIFKVLFRGREMEVKAKDLQQYDTVFNTFHNFLPINKNSYDYQLGQFIGILMGDGYVGRRGVVSVSINCKEKFIGDFLDNFLERYFNLKGTWVEDKRSSAYKKYEVYSVDLWDKIIKKYFKNGYVGKDKRPIINKESLEFKLGYIDGLLVTDGGYSKGHSLSLISKDVIKDVVDILYSIGFNKINIREFEDSRDDYKRQKSYIINIPVKINYYLDLTLLRRSDVLKDSAKTQEIFYIGKYAYKYANTNTIKRSIVSLGDIKAERRENYNCLTTDVVVDIEVVNNDDDYVYEIETNTHWYSAGGILTHNCGVADLNLVLSCFVDKALRELEDSHVKFKDEGQVWNYVKEEIVKFIYNINQSLRFSQSPFTNISIYDKYFLENLCPDYKIPEVGEAKVEIVQKVQKIFIEAMNEELQRTPITFPVITVCYTLDENNQVKDKEFLDFIAKQNLQFAFMNFYFGDTNTLSSCCFSGNQEVVVSCKYFTGKYSFKELDKLISKYNVKELKVRDGNLKWKDCSFVKIKNNKPLYRITLSNGCILECTGDHIWPTWEGDKETENLTCNDYLKSAFFTSIQNKWNDNDGLFRVNDEHRVFIKIVSIEKFKSNDGYVYCLEMKDKDNPYFLLANYIETHNCRLRSEIKGEFQNSFGAGSSKIGSVGVVTINLPRLAYETKDKNKFKEELKKLVYFTGMINNARRMIVKKRIELGTLPLYSYGYIDLKKQYSTTGITGLNEALEILGMDLLEEDAQQYVIELMQDINKCLNEMDKLYGYWHNVEQVPAESSAVKLAEKDRVLGYNKCYDLYSNQFVPLWVNADLFDRIIIQGKFDKWFSGGSILHLNVENEIKDAQVMKDLINACAKTGCIYFAVNYLLGHCENCNTFRAINKLKSNCEICGKELDVYQRVVGFLTNTKHWNSIRREVELAKRIHYNL